MLLKANCLLIMFCCTGSFAVCHVAYLLFFANIAISRHMKITPKIAKLAYKNYKYLHNAACLHLKKKNKPQFLLCFVFLVKSSTRCSCPVFLGPEDFRTDEISQQL